MKNYNIIEDGEGNNVKTTFLETYDHSGSVWITMKVELPGTMSYSVDFDNPAQVEQCMWQMQQYLKNRNTFRRVDPDSASNAAEPEPPYD